MIKEIVEKIVTEKLTIQTDVAKVVSVDEAEMTCEVSMVGKPNLTDVRLRSIIDSVDKGVLIVPKIGTYVLISLVNNKKGNAFVSGFSEVESVRIITDKIELSGNSFGGLIKVNELITQLDKLTARVDGIIDAIKDAAYLAQDGGASLQTTMKLKLATLVDKEDFASIENEKVKHG